MKINLSVAQQQGKLKNKIIEISIKKATIAQYLSSIQDQGISLAYSPNQLRIDKLVEIAPGRYSAELILNKLFFPDEIKITEQDHKLVLTPQQIQYTLNGFVYDAESKEALPGASIIILAPHRISIQTDNYGHYSLILKSKKNIITTYYTGYLPRTDTIIVNAKNTKHNIFIHSTIDTLAIVDINSPKNDIKRWNGQKSLSINEIYNHPGVLGNKDIYNILRHEPGFSSGSSGSGHWLIRGGNADQNLVLLDGIPVYSYSHMFGLSSIFNPDILKNADIYKGSFPARYDGRLSSVIDIKTKDGHMSELHGVANLGLLNGSIMLEGPIVKDKASFLMSGRRSWMDLLLPAFSADGINKTFMTDLNLKLNYIINPKNKIFLSTYYGNDFLNYTNKEDNSSNKLGWTNKLVAFRWFSIYHPKLTQHSTVVASEFFNNFIIKDSEMGNWKQYNKIIDVGIDNELKYYPNNEITTSIGFKAHRQSFSSPESSNTNIAKPQEAYKLKSIHLNAYIDNEIEIAEDFYMRAGLHYTQFIVDRKTYNAFQPRTSLSYRLNSNHSFFAGYATMIQFYNQISLGNISLPMELRIPSTKNIPPQEAISYEIGYILQNKFFDRLTLQLYQKDYRNVAQYRPYQSILQNKYAPQFDDRIISGTGRSQGLELSIQHNLKKTTAILSYTLSKTLYSFPSLNAGIPFPPRNESRHVASGILSINLSHKWKLGLNGRISSGQWINIPSYSIPSVEEVLGNGSISDDFQVVTFNSHRLRSNYDINISASKTSFFKKNRKGILSFGINNLTDSPVPMVTTVMGTIEELSTSSFLPFQYVPHISYLYEF